jgi:hypothetical protein
MCFKGENVKNYILSPCLSAKLSTGNSSASFPGCSAKGREGGGAQWGENDALDDLINFSLYSE